MLLDVYQPCPGGTNRKIKFCGCGKDILEELGKLHETLGAGQRAAVLSQLNQLLSRAGNRACLLALKCLVLLELNSLDELAATLEVYRQEYPNNPVMLAYSAILAVSTGDVDAAVSRLQEALVASQQTLDESVYIAYGLVGNLLTRAGYFPAALAHSMMRAEIAPEDHAQPQEELVAFLLSPRVPLIFKHRPIPLDAPADAPWAGEMEKIWDGAGMGHWLDAARQLKALAERCPDQPAILQRLAMCQSWVALESEAAATWRQFAAQPGVSLEDAVEAEALAQLLMEFPDRPLVERVIQTYPVGDTDRVMERLLSNPCVQRMGVDLTQLAGEDRPPPRGAFWLLDRPMPVSGQDLKAEQVSLVLGELFLFGRETDREARLEFATIKGADIENKQQILRDLLGEFGGEMVKEDVIEKMAAEHAALVKQWRLPDDTPAATRQELMSQAQQDLQMLRWPQTPLAVLDGKTPREAAADPATRIRVLAAILLQELSAEQSREQLDFNALRTSLGLPCLTDLDPDGQDLAMLPPTRLHRLPPERLSNESLLEAFDRAGALRAHRAVRRLGRELIARQAALQPQVLMRVYDILVSSTQDIDEAVELTVATGQLVVQLGGSPAQWYLRELRLQLMRGDAVRVAELFRRLQTHHRHEPGVSEALHSLLVQIGALTPDGRPTDRAMMAAQQQTATQAPAPGGLWTPDSPPAAAEGQEKSKLWMPGMP